MANSFVRYTGNGTTTAYAIPFSYRSVDDLSATVNGVVVTAYTLDGAGTTLTFTTAPAASSAIEIRRTTSQTTKLVDYVSGSVLTESDLDTDSDQAFYMAQEAIDKAGDVITLDNADFQWDVQSKRLKNVAAPTADTDAVNKAFISTNIPNITTVAGISSDVTTVAGISSDVTAVAADATDIGIVSTNIASVNTVATNIADVIKVADDLNEAISEVETVANDLNEATSEIETVANSITNVNLVGTDITNVNTVATNIANVNTVAGNNANVSTVAGISGNVTTVAGISADVTAVAGDATDIGTVATDIADVNTVAGSIANVNSVATNIANVNSVAGNSANINAVAGNATNINAVNANSANINTVAGANANVTTVAGSIANVNEVANNLGTVNNFGERYRVQAGEPSTNNDEGDLVYDTTANAVKVYNGSSFDTIQQGITDVAPTRHSIRPSLNLDFANSKALDPRITFTRASNATYYDGYTSVKAEENLLSYSRFNTQTNLDGGSRTSTTETAPDGTSTASEITYDGTTKTHYYKTNTLSATLPASTYTSSIFLKKGTERYMQVFQQISQSVINVDLDTGTTVDISSTPLLDHGAIDVGNGWYRVYMVSNSATQRNIWTLPITSMSSAYYESNSASGTTLFWGAQVEQRDSLTAYTPTTNVPITKYQPALQTAGNNVARFDHNPTTGESLGLLIEESRTNLINYSEAINSWSISVASIFANEAIAPDGTLTADKFALDSNSGYALQAISITSGTSYTYSAYMKKAENDFGMLRLQWDGNTYDTVNFNLSNGTTSRTPSGVDSTSIIDVGNGWYRCIVTFTPSASITTNFQIKTSDLEQTNSNSGYTGTFNGFNGIYVWGVQLEVGSFPTSYIKTTGSQVTRSSDRPVMENIDTSEWFKQGKGTLYTEVSHMNPDITSTNLHFLILRNSSSGDFLGMRFSGNEIIQFLNLNNGAYTVIINSSSFSTLKDTYYKASFSFTKDNAKTSLNGTTLGTDTSFNISQFDQLSFNYGTQQFNGYMKKASYYPINLTQNEINDLTEE